MKLTVSPSRKTGRSRKRPLTPIIISGEDVQVVNSYKFLGVHKHKGH